MYKKIQLKCYVLITPDFVNDYNSSNIYKILVRDVIVLLIDSY